ncbi:MAG TPA: hypothetical protein VI172_05845 [Candidatus Dormibacteraeota bacterium]|jgi:hypothetical protein
MGDYTSAYFAYGFQIPDTRSEQLDAALRDSPVSYLHAGDYDRDMTFLVTDCTEIDLGNHRKVKPDSFTQPQIDAWNKALTEAAARLGVTSGFEPGWFVVPDLS